MRSLTKPRSCPFEFWTTGHRPAPWAPADSILVAINMFQLLTYTERDERMLSVMSETLPYEVTAFLTPDTDASPTSGIGRRSVTANVSWPVSRFLGSRSS
ncbi:MAG: penicillin acylase family protein [Gammaproteobacteria bacterium]